MIRRCVRQLEHPWLANYRPTRCPTACTSLFCTHTLRTYQTLQSQANAPSEGSSGTAVISGSMTVETPARLAATSQLPYPDRFYAAVDFVSDLPPGKTRSRCAPERCMAMLIRGLGLRCRYILQCKSILESRKYTCLFEWLPSAMSHPYNTGRNGLLDRQVPRRCPMRPSCCCMP